MDILILFTDYYFATKAEEALQTAGIKVNLIPTPLVLKNTCGLCILIKPESAFGKSNVEVDFTGDGANVETEFIGDKVNVEADFTGDKANVAADFSCQGNAEIAHKILQILKRASISHSGFYEYNRKAKECRKIKI
ncbi:MAG: DUF3343 domain-containing protein [Veillonella sp.]|uniref:DUF3343 domain-containing protein n=1 Tax=Veillonella sp. TaxID=1926307 RepID=UPI0025FB688C|nr:DUF3343 domain-containing protein [Veillonella sp.]MBS4913324.1 DUF3343 domain-containing protein [Veillonella sp.]